MFAKNKLTRTQEPGLQNQKKASQRSESGEENSLLTGRNLQQNQNQVHCERPSVTTDWGFERTEQRHKKNTVVLSIGMKSEIFMVIAPLEASSRRERGLSR
ncbi:hypothetical protein XENOCAPTIV_027342 [Xenoophorus captivus]|uniref:Uncharacterized protein n=1 Tax=Xenoophorus captivus TaxID=1517983 RepID=A0ABV0QTP4_9TELE